jgi:N-acetylglucosamine repressor
MRFVDTMRERDKSVILDVVRRCGPISRVDIHEMTSLRPATISELTGELLQHGAIKQAGLNNNPTGRKQVLLQFNTEASFIAAVDFDAEFVSAGILDLQPRIRGEVIREATRLDGGSKGLLEQLVRCARKAIKQADLPHGSVAGIGIGDPGLVNSRDGISLTSSTIGFWRDIPTKQHFERAFGILSVVGNNTRTKSIAERLLGAGEASPDMIFVEYGKGIGAGIISGGTLLEGHGWTAGEFGHTHIVDNGPACNCGSFGCLEAIAGIGALEARIRRAVREGGYSECLTMAGGEPDSITGWHVLQAAAHGDKMAAALVEELGSYLGLGLANLVNLFNPALIVLDERLALAGPSLLEQITRVVRRQALVQATQNLGFRTGVLGSNAGLLGAGLLVLEELFCVPLFKPPRPVQS